MIRSIVVIILFAAIGYILAYVLNDAHKSLSNPQKKEIDQENKVDTTSTIDIRVNSDEDDELLKIIPQKADEEFTELSIQNFKRFMDQDSN
jgi:uncharacterized protein YrzB (UPF0473 family)